VHVRGRPRRLELHLRHAHAGDEDQLPAPRPPRPAPRDRRVVKWGRTIAFTEGELYDADGRLVAKATGTAMPTPRDRFKA
jgi:hypothetical protein